jgi:DNA transposition AAA+ family ATPase
LSGECVQPSHKQTDQATTANGIDTDNGTLGATLNQDQTPRETKITKPSQSQIDAAESKNDSMGLYSTSTTVDAGKSAIKKHP